jgi:hypothetical protein
VKRDVTSGSCELYIFWFRLLLQKNSRASNSHRQANCVSWSLTVVAAAVAVRLGRATQWHFHPKCLPYSKHVCGSCRGLQSSTTYCGPFLRLFFRDRCRMQCGKTTMDRRTGARLVGPFVHDMFCFGLAGYMLLCLSLASLHLLGFAAHCLSGFEAICACWLLDPVGATFLRRIYLQLHRSTNFLWRRSV